MSAPEDIERGLAAAGGNRFAFVSLVRVRANDLNIGAPMRTVTAKTDPVQIAIHEISRGRVRAATGEPRVQAAVEPDARIVCSECAAVVDIIRRGPVKQGRLPTRCAEHGLSENWQQITHENGGHEPDIT